MRKNHFIYTAIMLLLLSLIFQMAVSITAYADNDKKVVRVGWHEPPYFITDESGRV